MPENDTIAAVSTGMTQAGIAIIRISGPEALEVGNRLFRSRSMKADLLERKANTINFGYICDPAHDDAVIDEVMVSVMKHPYSYTTEDTVEINSHGGVYLTQKILSLVFENGARPAEPGEFTKRAFLGGRIDLARAEAVMDLISSQNEFARKTSLAQLEGAVSAKIRKLREEIIYELAFIESALDDPENYSMDGYPERLREKLTSLIETMRQLLAHSEEGRILKEGIRTVIVGKPNAGKSSLLNFLSGTDRAIVTDIAGTTRDTLSETVKVGDVLLQLTDTAGIHETADKVEKLGIERTRKAIEESELILFLADTSTEIAQEDEMIGSLLAEKRREGKKVIVLLNKSDLAQKTGREEIVKMLGETAESSRLIACSMQTGEGLESVKAAIAELFHTGEIQSSSEVFITSLRHRNLIAGAKRSLELVIESIDNEMSEDFFSIDLMAAYESLGKILGEQVEDDLVEEIFSKFCLGK